MGERIGLLDEEWELIGPLLRTERGRSCRPAHDSRRVFEGMMWMARTGLQWRQLPNEFRKWSSVFRRYRRWATTGAFDAMLERWPAWWSRMPEVAREICTAGISGLPV